MPHVLGPKFSLTDLENSLTLQDQSMLIPYSQNTNLYEKSIYSYLPSSLLARSATRITSHCKWKIYLNMCNLSRQKLQQLHYQFQIQIVLTQIRRLQFVKKFHHVHLLNMLLYHLQKQPTASKKPHSLTKSKFCSIKTYLSSVQETRIFKVKTNRL